MYLKIMLYLRGRLCSKRISNHCKGTIYVYVVGVGGIANKEVSRLITLIAQIMTVMRASTAKQLSLKKHIKIIDRLIKYMHVCIHSIPYITILLITKKYQ